MQRFTSFDFFSRELPSVHEYENNAAVSLREALAPIQHEIEDLDKYISSALTLCHHPSSEGLTRDESAAIYIYTMDCGSNSLYCFLNDALRNQDRRVLTPWNGYLKLFNNALDKLPSVAMSVWRGVNADISKNYRKDTEVTWWAISSCSKSLKVIEKFIKPASKSTVLMIEGKNVKEISKYSYLPDEEEVILRLGTKLRVMSDILEQPSINMVHLLEITDESSSESVKSFRSVETSSHNPPSPIVKHVSRKDDHQAPIFYPNGAIYRGESIDDVPQGRGVYTCPSGYRYEGEFEDGKQQGKGTSTFPDGGRYHGDFVDGTPDGHGLLMRPDGFQYEGQFYRGKRHGTGTCTYPNGGVYTGGFADGHPNGQGRFTFPNGYRYEGQFLNGRQHGKGSSKFPDGGKYQGDFVDGFAEGIGLLCRPDGYQYHGQFARGKRNGTGSCTCPNGARYSGEFLNGWAHGKGVYILPNGFRHEGYFVKGKAVANNNCHRVNIQLDDDGDDELQTYFFS